MRERVKLAIVVLLLIAAAVISAIAWRANSRGDDVDPKVLKRAQEISSGLSATEAPPVNDPPPKTQKPRPGPQLSR